MESNERMRSWNVVRLRNQAAAKVEAIATETGMDYAAVVHELIMYAMDHSHVGQVTRLGLIFDGEEAGKRGNKS